MAAAKKVKRKLGIGLRRMEIKMKKSKGDNNRKRFTKSRRLIPKKRGVNHFCFQIVVVLLSTDGESVGKAKPITKNKKN